MDHLSVCDIGYLPLFYTNNNHILYIHLFHLIQYEGDCLSLRVDRDCLSCLIVFASGRMFIFTCMCNLDGVEMNV